MVSTRKSLAVQNTAILCTGAFLLAGCTQWQYPWRKSQQSAAKPKITAQKADEPPPTPMVDPEQDGIEVASDSSPPNQSTELNDMLARLRQASNGGGHSDGATLNRPAPESASRGAPASKAANARNKPAVTAVDTKSHDAQSTRAEPVVSPPPAAIASKQSAPVAPVVLSVRVDDGRRSGASTATQSPMTGANTAMANQAIHTETPRPADPLDQAVHRIESAAKAQPSNVRSQWQLSLLKLASGESPPGEAPHDGAAANSALLDSAVRATAATGSVLTDPMATHDEALEAVDELRDALRNEAELRIPVVALCSRVDAFGVYEELPDGAISPNRINRAIVYGEVQNFASESKDRGYRTVLSSRLELFTADGRSVWNDQQDRIEDFCRRRREDFFIAQLVTLPVLSPGDYVLKMTVTDLLASKTNQAAKSITVGGSSALTASRR